MTEEYYRDPDAVHVPPGGTRRRMSSPPGEVGRQGEALSQRALDFAVWLNDESEAASDPDSAKGYAAAARCFEDLLAQLAQVERRLELLELIFEAAVGHWHDALEGTEELHEWLGLTWEQYGELVSPPHPSPGRDGMSEPTPEAMKLGAERTLALDPSLRERNLAQFVLSLYAALTASHAREERMAEVLRWCRTGRVHVHLIDEALADQGASGGHVCTEACVGLMDFPHNADQGASPGERKEPKFPGTGGASTPPALPM